jgi:H+/Cl- antiporter ClcA
MFVVLQAALAAQIYVEESRTRDPWLRRALLAALAILAAFFPWYLRRYYAFPWPVADPFKTLGVGLLAAFLLVLWDWALTEGKDDAMMRSEPLSGDGDGEIPAAPLGDFKHP